MIDVRLRRSRRGSRASTSTSSASSAASTGSCSLAVGALVAYGLWAIAGITRHDVAGDENYYVVRQAIAAGLGFAGFLVALADRPRPLPPRAEGASTRVTLALMLLVFPLADATRGSKRWIEIGSFQFQPSEFGKLLFVLALAGFLADRARRLHEPQGRAAGARARRAADRCSSSSSPTSARRSSTARRSLACLFVAGIRWTPPRPCSSALVALLASSVLWFLPAAGVEVLKPYQTARLTGFTNPDERPGGTTYNVNQSITAVGSGGLDGRGVAGRDADEARLPARARHRLRLRRRSPSSAASSAPRSCSSSTCSSSGAGSG